MVNAFRTIEYMQGKKALVVADLSSVPERAYVTCQLH